MGSFAWERSLGIFRLGYFAWDFSRGTGLGNRALEAEGAGGHRRGNPGTRALGNCHLRNEIKERTTRAEIIKLSQANSSSTSVGNPNLKKHVVWKSMDMCRNPMW